MKNGCNTCKNYRVGKFSMNKIDVPPSCTIGKTKEMEQWWEENGYKKSIDFVTEMECFEETEFSKKCDELIKLLDEFNKLGKD